MMNVLIDNKDFKSEYQIEVLDYTSAFGIAQERADEREWSIKSGVDRNRQNIRFEAKEFILYCSCKSDDEAAAYNLVKTLIDYMFLKGVFVISFRDASRGIRECFLCERSNTIIPTVHVRAQNGLYIFKLGLKDVNPNAIIYKTSIVAGEVTINYTKGLTADIYWGNGENAEVSNSGNYTKTGYLADGLVDIIIDVDKDLPDVTSLVADFHADEVSGIKEFTVNFTDDSTGEIVLWSWNFGDGKTSSEQNPSHTYTQKGTFTVTLQIFNSAQGSAVETKINYITVRDARMLVDDAGHFALKNDLTDYGLIN